MSLKPIRLSTVLPQKYYTQSLQSQNLVGDAVIEMGAILVMVDGCKYIEAGSKRVV